MILILSINGDLDTQLTIDWLRYWNEPFFRLNDDALMNGEVIFEYNIKNPENSTLENTHQKININEIQVVWYRKSGFLRDYESEPNELKSYIKSEFVSSMKILMELLSPKKWLNKMYGMPTKTEQLRAAYLMDINIPETLITNKKKSVLKFKEQQNKIITKALYEPKHFFDEENNYYPLFTFLVSDINSIPDSFSPSIIQNCIEKEYELRSFYLEGNFWTMAIFSQNNSKTQLDFRNYDKNKPNRTVPYKLPQILEQKLDKLMKNLNLQTGSIDLIKETSGNYIFLEVNPSGQFGMTAFPCNYNLYKEVAKSLIPK